MPHRPRLRLRLAVPLLLASLASTLAVPQPAGAEPRDLELTLLSFNVAGIPVVHADIDARIAAIAAVLADVHADVVCMQEVWRERDADTLTGGGRAVGLEHARWFRKGQGGSGLLILSRFAMLDAAFVPFRVEGDGWRLALGHADHLAEKGVATVRLDTPLGPVAVLNTHMIARHMVGGRDDVEHHRYEQAKDIVAALAAVEREVPTFLLGDLNAERASAEMRMLWARGGLADTYQRPADRGRRIDYVLFREPADPAAYALEVLAGEKTLDRPVARLDGAPLRLSDHPAVIARVRLRREIAAPGPHGPAAKPDR